MENKKHGELTQINGTYGKALLDHKDMIEKSLGLPVNDYKKVIIKIIEENSKDTPKRKLFIQNLMKKRSNNDILMYCWNAMLSADNLNVVKN